MLNRRSKKGKKASCEFEEQAAGSSRRCWWRNAAERVSSWHDPVSAGAPKRQACVLKLVCGCNNSVFMGARRLYSLAWVLVFIFLVFCLKG